MRRMQTVGLGAMLWMALAGAAGAQTSAEAQASAGTQSPAGTQPPAGKQAAGGAQAGVAAAPAPNAPKSPLPAQTLIDEAVKKAKAEHKAVFVHLGASWCGYCHLLDEFLDSPEAGPIMAAHYEIVSLTTLEQGDNRVLENPGADSIMQAMGVDGLPGFFFLDDEGKQTASSMVDGTNMGYPGGPDEIKTFGEFLRKTAPRMTDADRTKVLGYLTDVSKSLTEH